MRIIFVALLVLFAPVYASELSKVHGFTTNPDQWLVTGIEYKNQVIVADVSNSSCQFQLGPVAGGRLVIVSFLIRWPVEQTARFRQDHIWALLQDRMPLQPIVSALDDTPLMFEVGELTAGGQDGESFDHFTLKLVYVLPTGEEVAQFCYHDTPDVMIPSIVTLAVFDPPPALPPWR